MTGRLMTRRPRTSTLVLMGLFLGVLTLYILISPVPTPTASPAPAVQPFLHVQRHAVCV